jgi:hypothetical protein
MAENNQPNYPANRNKNPSVSTGFLLSQVFLAGLMQFPFWLGFFLLLYWFDCRWAAQGVALVLGVHWDDAFLGAFLVSFTTAFLLLPDFLEKRFRNKPNNGPALTVAKHYRAPQIQRLFRTFRLVAVTLTTIFLFFSSYSGLAFTESGFYDRAALGDTTGVYHPYSAVTALRLVEEDGLFSGSDYEIVLSSGDTLRVGEDYGISLSKFETAALPLFQAAGVPIESED